MLQISPNAFQLVLDSIAPTPGEKRRSSRNPAKGQIQIVPCWVGIGAQPVLVEVRDVSAGGISFIHSAPVERGWQFLIVLAPERAMLCTCMRWQPIAQSTFVIGAEYVREISAAETRARAAILA